MFIKFIIILKSNFTILQYKKAFKFLYNIQKLFNYNNTPQNCDFLDAYSDGCVKFTSEHCFQTMSFKKPVI